MRILVGSTGFVGSALAEQRQFDQLVHRSNLEEIRGVVSDEVVCAGLPGAKYLANENPEADWANTRKLAEVLSTVETRRFVLISTVDVYDPPAGVDEHTPPALDGSQAYGRNRAWFEAFARAAFPECLIVRLPAMYGDGLRKNLVFDLLEGRSEHFQRVSPASTFQFFDVAQIWRYVETCIAEQLPVVNFGTEPVSASEIAGLFGVELSSGGRPVNYDVRTLYAGDLGGRGDYLISRAEQLDGIRLLAARWNRGLPEPGAS